MLYFYHNIKKKMFSVHINDDYQYVGLDLAQNEYVTRISFDGEMIRRSLSYTILKKII